MQAANADAPDLLGHARVELKLAVAGLETEHRLYEDERGRSGPRLGAAGLRVRDGKSGLPALEARERLRKPVAREGGRNEVAPHPTRRTVYKVANKRMPRISRRRSSEAPADPRRSPQITATEALLTVVIPAYPRPARNYQDRPVTPEVAGSSPVAPVASYRNCSASVIGVCARAGAIARMGPVGASWCTADVLGRALFGGSVLTVQRRG